jgi:hypothetical protein
MGEIVKHFDDYTAMYKFSEDLLSGVRFFAHLATNSENQQQTIHFNTSCIFLAGSYIESWLNETIATYSSMGPDSGVRPSPDFWIALDLSQSTMSLKVKWDLIASIDGGTPWDLAREPFQSYGLILSLRNELVHFKGKFDSGEKPPVKKITKLLEKFSGDSQPSLVLEAMASSSWVHNLLTARPLGTWVAEALLVFDRDFQHLLTGVEPTKEKKDMHRLKRMFR